MSSQPFATKLAQLRYDRVIAIIDSLSILPTAVNVPMRIMELYRSPKLPPLDEFASVIIADPSLSAKLLELANSSWFSPTRPVARVTDAIRMIGLNNVLPLLFGVSLSGIFNRINLPSDERAVLWQASIFKAVAAREWARANKIEQAEEAFLAGLLQDIALPALFASDRAASFELAGILDLDDDIRPAREFELYGADHAEFGRQIAIRLRLPEPYITATGSHHHLDGVQLDSQYTAIGPALAMASALPHGMTRIDDLAMKRVRSCFRRFAAETTDKQITSFIQRVQEGVKAFTVMLTPASGGTDLRGFLQEAAEQITRGVVDAIGSARQTISQLQSQQHEMEDRIRELEAQIAKADYDDLSGVLNRRGFYERADQVMHLARRYQRGCAVAFTDLNDFKSINDRFGHDTGDQALALFASALKKLVGDRGIVGRCGGDEFAAILVFPAESTRIQVEQTLVRALDGLSLSVGAEQVSVSGSLGLTWLGIPADSDTAQRAPLRADDEMYQAKRAAKRSPPAPGPNPTHPSAAA